MKTQFEYLWQYVQKQLPQAPYDFAGNNSGVWAVLRRSHRQTATPSCDKTPLRLAPRRIGIALGGGGGKGGAHLGVLAVLEALEVPIDLIVGTSIGGAVAVFYAAGFKLDDIARSFRMFSLRRIASPDPTRTGLIGLRKREALLMKLLGDRTFADLDRPCAVVTTDLVSGCEVIIDQGPLVPAILATTAIPGIFPPVVRDQKLLADGGILNNLPVDVAERLGAQRVIAVQLVSKEPDFVLPMTVPSVSLARMVLAPQQFAIANRALALLMAQATDLRLAQNPPAVLLRPNVHDIGTLDMTCSETGYQAGEVAAREATEALVALRAWRLASGEPTPHAVLSSHRSL